MNRRSRREWVSCALVVAVALACGLAFPPWPDDWDGLGFLASIARFDLASFAPHPPGYPVYVALLKVAALTASRPIAAARVVGVASLLVTLFALRRTLPHEGALSIAVLLTPLLFHAFSGVGSEGPALACVAVVGAGLIDARAGLSERARSILVGLGVGLGLGVRLSWAPFFASLLALTPRSLRRRAWSVAGLSILAWAVPMALLTGPSNFVALGRVHFEGHMNRWGGTFLTEPTRLPFLARDLFVDGFGGGTDVLGLALFGALGWACVDSFARWRSRTTIPERRTIAVRVTILVVPYLAWVTFGQNLRQQPRHVLPLVVVLAWALASSASTAFATPARRSLQAAWIVFAALLFTRTSLDAWQRAHIPPPGVQLLAYVRANASPSSTVVFTGASGRFLDGTEWKARAHAVGTTSDAWLALTREDRVPRSVFVTGEVTGVAEETPAGREVARFCRPERLDRRLPCLPLFVFDGSDAITR